MRCLLKPIHWNPKGFLRPAGHKASSGYPKQYGFGHEEWNNAPRMRVQIEGRWYRAFHIEIGESLGDPTPEESLVLMYANHDHVHQLVGVAARARRITGPINARLRRELREQIESEQLWQDAWEVPLVRQKFLTPVALRRHLNAGLGNGPSWICPEDCFVWLKAPLTLDPTAISGKSKLLTLFSGHTELTLAKAAFVLEMVPKVERTMAWHKILELLTTEAEASDIADLKRRRLDATTRQALMDARLGQGQFRTELLHREQGQCMLTHCAVTAVLRASHIKPWAEASDLERLDPDNGLLLAAQVDALFDQYLISFDDRGQMWVSDEISRTDLEILGIKPKAKIPLSPSQNIYMAHHWNKFSLKQPQHRHA